MDDTSSNFVRTYLDCVSKTNFQTLIVIPDIAHTDDHHDREITTENKQQGFEYKGQGQA